MKNIFISFSFNQPEILKVLPLGGFFATKPTDTADPERKKNLKKNGKRKNKNRERKKITLE